MRNYIVLGLTLFGLSWGYTQIEPGVYKAREGHSEYLIFATDTYMVQTVYETAPSQFISTMGGFYALEEDQLKLSLEFDSESKTNGLKEYVTSYGYVDGHLILDGNESRPYTKEPSIEQPLDGLWLFATRGPDEGQERRGPDQGRKTLKVLMDAYFQWIAYDSDSMGFMGTGGGRYAANGNTYTEVIQFFSRDNSRVGAELSFTFDRQENDWHHSGKNSRGEPMYEIWAIWEMN